jgi:oligoendopeptidase F
MPSQAITELPEWNLTDLYAGIDDPVLASDLEDVEAQCKRFQVQFAGQLGTLDGAGLAAVLAEYEQILEVLYRVMSYAQLLHAGAVTDPAVGRFYQTTQERVTEITSQTLFMTLELNRLDDQVIETLLSDAALAHYRPWIEDVRIMRPYQLSDEVEKLLHEKSVAGRNAWIRLFDETMAHMRFDIAGNELNLSDTLNHLSDKDGDARRAAGKALVAGLESNGRLLAMVTNTLAKDKSIEDDWRGYDNPAQPRHLANQVEPEVVSALVSAVQDSYADLAHRYYRLKARWMGVEQMDWWDRNAPLPDDAGTSFDWAQAKTMVLDAYGGFAPEMAELAGKFFDQGWISAPPRDGKASGAFAHPTVPSVHPYVLLNYHGKARDVMTLAHELGHGVHQVLAGPQGILLSNTPLTLAETASVFGEMLTFRALLNAEADPARRRVLLAGKVEDMLNTVVRQVAFHDYETQVHAARRSGELSLDQLGDIWMDTQTKSLGPVFRFDDDYRLLWGYIPHFIHAPFYVYAYAFGDCLVNALYGVFAEGHAGFQDKYFDMLRAGGSKRHKELLAPFGLDASDPAFWKRGLSVVSGFIDELEAEL